MTDAMIRWLTDSEATDPGRTGGKGANLAVLARAGLPVPPGVVVVTAAYVQFVGEHRLDALIQSELADIGADPDAVDAASSRLR
ncbi:phosphoenolpyruvate synthase, partial [Mycobacterium sp. ITM-2017-0098]